MTRSLPGRTIHQMLGLITRNGWLIGPGNRPETMRPYAGFEHNATIRYADVQRPHGG